MVSLCKTYHSFPMSTNSNEYRWESWHRWTKRCPAEHGDALMERSIGVMIAGHPAVWSIWFMLQDASQGRGGWAGAGRAKLAAGCIIHIWSVTFYRLSGKSLPKGTTNNIPIDEGAKTKKLRHLGVILIGFSLNHKTTYHMRCDLEKCSIVFQAAAKICFIRESYFKCATNRLAIVIRNCCG